jgi:hypothetical protein
MDNTISISDVKKDISFNKPFVQYIESKGKFYSFEINGIDENITGLKEVPKEEYDTADYDEKLVDSFSKLRIVSFLFGSS